MVFDSHEEALAEASRLEAVVSIPEAPEGCEFLFRCGVEPEVDWSKAPEGAVIAEVPADAFTGRWRVVAVASWKAWLGESQYGNSIMLNPDETHLGMGSYWETLRGTFMQARERVEAH